MVQLTVYSKKKITFFSFDIKFFFHLIEESTKFFQNIKINLLSIVFKARLEYFYEILRNDISETKDFLEIFLKHSSADLKATLNFKTLILRLLSQVSL